MYQCVSANELFLDMCFGFGQITAFCAAQDRMNWPSALYFFLCSSLPVNIPVKVAHGKNCLLLENID